MLKVYSMPDIMCYQCKMTKKILTELGFVDGTHFQVIDVIDNPEVGDQLRDEGFKQMPVVKAVDGDVWAGFRPDKIRALDRPNSAAAG